MDKVAIRKSKDSLLFKNLEKFNKTCANNTFDKAMDHIIKSASDNLFGIGTVTTGSAVVQGVILISLALMIIPIMRELIYFFYYSRVKVSDYISMQSDLLIMNSYRVKQSSLDNSDDIAEKQNKIAEKLKRIANAIEVNMNKADRDSEKEIKKIDKKYNADEIFKDQAPDSASALF